MHRREDHAGHPVGKAMWYSAVQCSVGERVLEHWLQGALAP